MKQMMIIITVLALAAILAAPTAAQMRMRGEYGGGSYRSMDITAISDLKLSDEQALKLKALWENHLRDTRPRWDKRYEKSIELRDLWLEQKPDRHKIETLQQEMQILQTDILKKYEAYRMESMKLLTEKQKTIFKSCEEKRDYGYGKGIRGRVGMKRPEYLTP